MERYIDLTHKREVVVPDVANGLAQAAEGQDQFNFHVWLQQEAGRAAWGHHRIFNSVPSLILDSIQKQNLQLAVNFWRGIVCVHYMSTVNRRK